MVRAIRPAARRRIATAAPKTAQPPEDSPVASRYSVAQSVLCVTMLAR